MGDVAGSASAHASDMGEARERLLPPAGRALADLDAIARCRNARSWRSAPRSMAGQSQGLGTPRLRVPPRSAGSGGFWVAERAVASWGRRLVSRQPGAGCRVVALPVRPSAGGRPRDRPPPGRARRSARHAPPDRPRLHVWSSMNAVGFYQTLGYRVRRRARWPIQRGIELDYVLMTKRLGRTQAAATVASAARSRVPWRGPTECRRRSCHGLIFPTGQRLSRN